MSGIINGLQSAASIWQQYAPASITQKAAGSVAATTPSIGSAASSAVSGVQSGASVFQSLSTDLQSLLIQQQSVSPASSTGANAIPVSSSAVQSNQQPNLQSASGIADQFSQSALLALQAAF